MYIFSVIQRFVSIFRTNHNAWLSSLVQGTLTAARNLGQLKANCTWKGQDCVLAIKYDVGFILTER